MNMVWGRSVVLKPRGVILTVAPTLHWLKIGPETDTSSYIVSNELKYKISFGKKSLHLHAIQRGSLTKKVNRFLEIQVFLMKKMG